jgi:MFS family permease
MSKLAAQLRKNLRFNVAISMADAALFGIGWGFSSFGTVIPLFVNQMTDSAILIGLIPAIHAVGWQLPQLFTANWVSRLRRYKPAVLLMTIHERIPFMGLALAAFLLPRFGAGIVLPLTFLLLIWQGLGSGFTANPWQSMIAKIIPPDSHGTFFGAQAAVANILISASAVGAGYLLDLLHTPLDFILCFAIASVAYWLSMAALSFTREPEDTEKEVPTQQPSIFTGMGDILRKDRNFAWFLVMRFLYQFATMGFAFYIVYPLRQFGMNEIVAGYLTATLTITQTMANVGMGWLSDRVGHRNILIFGMVAVTASSLLAWAADAVWWFYPVFIISALANVAYWTIGMAMTVGFGTEAERPVYIGMSNTLAAPATIIAPILGGWIADLFGYKTTFMLSAIGGVLVGMILIFLIKDPHKATGETTITEAVPELMDMVPEPFKAIEKTINEQEKHNGK